MQRISSQEEDLAAGCDTSGPSGKWNKSVARAGYERDRARRGGLRELETKLADAGVRCVVQLTFFFRLTQEAPGRSLFLEWRLCSKSM